MTDDALSLRQNSTLSSLIAERIEGSILSGELAAGERINEAVLAKQYGVSRGPLREAARLLASQGIVEFVANKGAFVREVSREEVLEIYDLRAVLTGHACRLAARNKAGSLTELKALHGAMAEAAEKDERETYYRLNLAFHDALIDLAQSPRLGAMLQGLVKEAHLFRQVSLSRHPDMAQSNIEHGKILAAIARGDAYAAGREGEAHVRAGKHRFEAAMADRQSET